MTMTMISRSTSTKTTSTGTTSTSTRVTSTGATSRPIGAATSTSRTATWSSVAVAARRKRDTQLAQSQLRSNQQRKGSVSSRQATQARAQVARQPAAGTRQAGAGTRRPAATTGGARQPQQSQQRRVSQQPAGTAKKSAFDAKPRQEVRKEAQRGSQSRSARTARDHPAPPGGGTAASLAAGDGQPRLRPAPGSLAPAAGAPERIHRTEPEPAARFQSWRAIAWWRTRRWARAVGDGRYPRGGTEHAA